MPSCFCAFQDVDLNKNSAYVWEGVQYYCDKLLYPTGMMINKQAYDLNEVENKYEMLLYIAEMFDLNKNVHLFISKYRNDVKDYFVLQKC